MSNEGPTDWKQVVASYRWPLVVICLALIPVLLYVLTLRQAAKAGSGVANLITGAADRAEAVAENFLTANITETFLASIPEIDASGSGNLEVAKAEITETFTRSDERRILWDNVSIGTTVTEIKVPVTYRYHLRLDDPWRLEVSGQTCLVFAPEIRPTQPPAIHTDRMTQRVEEDWLRFDGEEQLDQLRSSITPRLEARAAGDKHLALVREPSRRTVAEFIRSWLLREDQWRDDRFHSITVVFADEEPQSSEKLDITIALE